MNFPNKQTVEQVRSQYPQGTKVELIAMSDPYATLKAGDIGVVDFVDDTGTVFVKWDSGSSLGVVYGEDAIRKLTESEIIKWQCRKIAETGRTNMFDAIAVFEISIEMGFYELTELIFNNTNRYSKLIMTGELNDVE